MRVPRTRIGSIFTLTVFATPACAVGLGTSRYEQSTAPAAEAPEVEGGSMRDGDSAGDVPIAYDTGDPRAAEDGGLPFGADGGQDGAAGADAELEGAASGGPDGGVEAASDAVGPIGAPEGGFDAGQPQVACPASCLAQWGCCDKSGSCRSGGSDRACATGRATCEDCTATGTQCYCTDTLCYCQ